MMKRFASFVAAALVLTGLSFAAPTAANAQNAQTCVAQGRANLSAGLGLPPSSVSASFTIGADVSVCVNGGVGASVSASGNLQGACGRSTGSGSITTPAGTAGFSYQSGASILIIIPNPVGAAGYAGVANAVSDVTVANNSCVNGTARVFLVTTVLERVL